MATLALPDAPRVIALAGPTASGKSAAALAIAQQFGAEIISVDSALVYRGMDIGTAKPTAAELAQVQHHLIDIRDPTQPYNAAEFASDARKLIGVIHSRGKVALLAGGTMLYFKALFDGLDAMPPADLQVRAQLEEEASQLGWPAMHAALVQVDPITAARLAPNDAQRIQRALEVFRSSGQPLSYFHSQAQQGEGLQPAGFFSLEPTDRAWLHARIAQRFDAMLANGFMDEARALRMRGDLDAAMPSMRCVGYRQAWEALDGLVPMDEMRERGIAATRQLAKRQLTWLRSMPARTVIAADAPDALAQLLRAVEQIA